MRPQLTTSISTQMLNYVIFAPSFEPTTLLVVLVSCIQLGIESLPRYYLTLRSPPTFWFSIECFCVAYLTIEYLTRWWAHLGNRVRFPLQFLNILDLLAVIPFYIERILDACGGIPTYHLMDLRVLRLFRVTRAVRFFPGGSLVLRAFTDTAPTLGSCLVAFVLLLFFWSSLLYTVERAHSRFDPGRSLWVRPRYKGLVLAEEVSPFQSVYHTLWWAATSMCTVGYGDAVPLSAMGKIIATLTMLSGIFMLALPTSVVGSRFLHLYRNSHRKAEFNCLRKPVDHRKVCIASELGSLAEDALLTDDESHRLHQVLWDKKYERALQQIYQASLLTQNYDLRRRRFVENLHGLLAHDHQGCACYGYI